MKRDLNYKRVFFGAIVLCIALCIALTACGLGTTDGKSGGTKHIHSYGEWVVDKEPTCTSDGSRYRECACGARETETLSATGHTEVIDPAVAPTCVDGGKTEGSHCSVCGEPIVAQQTVPATGVHDYGEDERCTICGAPHPYTYGVSFVKKENGEYEASGFDGSTETVVLPSVYHNAPVTSVGSGLFAGATGLVSVVLPDGLTAIGEGIFAGCASLRSVSVPYVGAKPDVGADFREKDQYTFGYFFGKDPFLGGVAVEQTYVKDGNGRTYSAVTETYYLPESLTELTVRGGYLVTDALENCASLQKIDLGGVKRIADNALRGCFALTELTMGDQLTSIDSYAFRDCVGLREIVIPDSVTSLGSGIFDHCASLEKVTVPFIGRNADIGASPTDQYQYTFGNFFGLSSYEGAVEVTQTYRKNVDPDHPSETKTYYLPGTLTEVVVRGGYLNNNAFADCSFLTKITLGEEVKQIGLNAFKNCTGLTSITSPASVTAIYRTAFSGCDNLAEAVFLQTSGWKIRYTQSISVSDPAENALRLTGEYLEENWTR